MVGSSGEEEVATKTEGSEESDSEDDEEEMQEFIGRMIHRNTSSHNHTSDCNCTKSTKQAKRHAKSDWRYKRFEEHSKSNMLDPNMPLCPLFSDQNGAINPLTGKDAESDNTDGEPFKTEVKELMDMINGFRKQEFETMPCPVIVDSGAADNVLPEGWCPQAVVMKGRSTGRTYTAANGSPIESKGAELVTMMTREGQRKDMNFQVCDVTRPLASVYKICEAGHGVIFNPSWAPADQSH